jgi:hypothetical protein
MGLHCDIIFELASDGEALHQSAPMQGGARHSVPPHRVA